MTLEEILAQSQSKDLRRVFLITLCVRIPSPHVFKKVGFTLRNKRDCIFRKKTRKKCAKHIDIEHKSVKVATAIFSTKFRNTY